MILEIEQGQYKGQYKIDSTDMKQINNIKDNTLDSTLLIEQVLIYLNFT